MSTDGVAVWLYAVIRGEIVVDHIAGLTGVDGERVRHLDGGDLSAIVGTVHLDEFGEAALRRNLENLDWLSVTARAHDAVISAIARSGPVLPVRMATVYLDDERVKQLLETRRQDFLAALDRVTGRDELGVKAHADLAALMAGSSSVQQPAGERPSGTAYLMKRRQELTSQDRAHSAAAAEAERLHAALLQHAVDGKQKPPGDSALTGKRAWTVLNGTYLVDRDRVEAFRAAVVALQKTTAGVELEITGPWPPYSFTGDVVSP
jgi:hypothetical protein